MFAVRHFWWLFFMVSCWYLMRLRRLYLDLHIFLNFWLNFILLLSSSSSSTTSLISFLLLQKYRNFGIYAFVVTVVNFDCHHKVCLVPAIFSQSKPNSFNLIECEWDGKEKRQRERRERETNKNFGKEKNNIRDHLSNRSCVCDMTWQHAMRIQSK